jgi:outer membrane cobalamin receptor
MEMVSTFIKKSCALVAVLLFFAGVFNQVFSNGIIKGLVVDRATRQPLPGANIRVVGTAFGTIADVNGRFTIAQIPDGTYALEAAILGYQAQRLENKFISTNTALEVNFELDEAAIPLSEVIVTPGHFTIMQNEPAVRQALSREEIQSIPHFGEDIYRAVQRLPGIAGNDFSAKFTVRGGENKEVLVLLDGLELYEPFHLNDVGGALSIVDVEAISGINLITGGFPAEYGDRLSGVFDISSITPEPGQRRTALGLSLLNARFKTEGLFKNGRGQWFVSARRGYIDLVLKLIGEEDHLSPDYYDVLGKVQYQLSERHSLAAHVLRSGDQFDFLEEDDGAQVNSGYGNTYGWLTLESVPSQKLFVQTVFSAGHVARERTGTDFSGANRQVRAYIAETRAFQVYNLKQDWQYEWSDRHFLKWGFDLKSLRADYDYFNRERVTPALYDTIMVNTNPAGRKLGFYLADRVRLLKPLTAEAGLRYDDNSYAVDQNFSPRLNLAYTIGRNSVARLGWGRFYQAQGIHELEVQDGENKFFPAELAEHRVIGFEHNFAGGVNIRFEAYQKRLSQQRPYYSNLLDATHVLIFPEVEEDRVMLVPQAGEAKGIELFVKKDNGGKLNWWGSYAFAFAEDQIDGKAVPRSFDQRHTAYLDFNYRPNPKWRLNWAWQYHSGWPYTETAFKRATLPNGGFSYDLVYGPRNAARLPAYHRFDVRANRYFDVGKGRLSVFLEVINLYNRTNVRTYEYGLEVEPNSQFTSTRRAEKWLPRLPSIGISWEF